MSDNLITRLRTSFTAQEPPYPVWPQGLSPAMPAREQAAIFARANGLRLDESDRPIRWLPNSPADRLVKRVRAPLGYGWTTRLVAVVVHATLQDEAGPITGAQPDQPSDLFIGFALDRLPFSWYGPDRAALMIWMPARGVTIPSARDFDFPGIGVFRNKVPGDESLRGGPTRG